MTGIGGQLVLTAIGLVLLSTAASAHTSTIDISCTQVEFVYQNFPHVTATAHESVVVNGVEIATHDITFPGPGTTDTITIALGSGSNNVAASDQWSYRGSPQGSANSSQTLKNCHSGSTTTTVPATTTSVPATSTSTSPSTTTSVPATSTSTSPSSTSTTSTSVPDTSTSTTPSSSTSTSSATSSTTMPGTSTTFHTLGSTTSTTAGTTSSTVHEVGSTTTTTGHGHLPFTGSSGLPYAAALGALGVGVLAVGLARLHRAV